MRRRDSRLDDHLPVLVRLQERAGLEVYARAVEAARVAVAKVVLAEAERLAGVRQPTGKLIQFPVARRPEKAPEQVRTSVSPRFSGPACESYPAP